MSTNELVLFRGYYFNEQMGLVVHRSGKPAYLRAKTTRVFRLLADTPNSVVTRQQFEEEVWGNSIVTPDSLTQCIFEIRKCLGDAKRKTLVTIPKIGYLLRDDKTMNPPEEFVFNTDPFTLRIDSSDQNRCCNFHWGESAERVENTTAVR